MITSPTPKRLTSSKACTGNDTCYLYICLISGLGCTKGSHCPCLEGTCKCSRYQEDLNLHSAKDHEDDLNLTNAKDHLFCQCYDGK